MKEKLIFDSMISNEVIIEIIISMEKLKVFVIVKIKNMFKFILLYSFYHLSFISQ